MTSRDSRLWDVEATTFDDPPPHRRVAPPLPGGGRGRVV